MLTQRRSFSLVAMPNGILAIGGHDGKNYLSNVEAFNYSSKKWIKLMNMNQARCTHSAIVSRDFQEVWVSGGFAHEALKSIEVFDLN